jgi:M3 family oligoendopeptidase
MKFSQYEYVRPDIDSLKLEFKDLLGQFQRAESFEKQSELIATIDQLREEVDVMQNICHIRHTIDTTNKFYESEMDFFNTRYPELGENMTAYYNALISSPYRAKLEEVWGKQLFVLAELYVKTFEPSILENLIEENKLDTEYRKIKAQADIEFEGQQYNLSTIEPMELSSDRATRQKAAAAKWGFFAKHATEIEGIYDKLVHCRHRIAQQLGYKNYIELGYARMRRSDYTADMVAKFREQIVKYVVPIAEKLYARQSDRLGYGSLEYYDEPFRFKTGNPTPKGNGAWMEARAKEMYTELSAETHTFFDFMMKRELMDLESKNGKETGGYCTFIGGKYRSPFIFSNFNGTSHDVVVLTHEAGHAFQCFETSHHIELYDYLWPTYEACEIHSMAMEFLTWPWMNLFFEEDTEKFLYEHLGGAIRFLPYGCAVDEFQHIIYENPHYTPEQRNAVWSEMERKYLPHRKNGDNAFLAQGGFWQKQSHIFGMPFYYIDYVLAQICAFQFWTRCQTDREGAWRDYVSLCQLGGKHAFIDLVKMSNLQSPFEDGCVASVVGPIDEYLSKIDDSKW